jgi:F-type H+-transporting ATPase subunit b
MPQLDISNFSSQIFWLIICFTILYFYLSKIIIPRIDNIISTRKNIIEEDVNQSHILQQKIDKLQQESNNIRNESSIEYKNTIDQAHKKALNSRNFAILKLKERIESISINSKNEIIKFITHCEQEKEKLVKEFIIIIKSKLFKS